MGRLIAGELDNMKWGFYSCLLFIGISSPAFHQFYKNSNSIVFKGGLHHEKKFENYFRISCFRNNYRSFRRLRR